MIRRVALCNRLSGKRGAGGLGSCWSAEGLCGCTAGVLGGGGGVGGGDM